VKHWKYNVGLDKEEVIWDKVRSRKQHGTRMFGPGISVGGAPQGRKASACSSVGVHKFGTRSEQKYEAV
jgi:hypothetical protein